MLSSLVISSSSNAVKYSALFRSLGTQVSFLVLDHTKNTVFTPLNDHRMLADGVMHYLDPAKNTISSHIKNYENTEFFTTLLKNYFLSDLKSKKNMTNDLSVNSSTDPIQFFEKNEIVDLKVNKNLKNVQLEIANKGLVSFDHLFVEQTDSCLQFLKDKSPVLIKTVRKPTPHSNLIWSCYRYKLSGAFSTEDFWFLENKNYYSLFDNCLYLQTQKEELLVWCLTPEHQALNQQFHQDFQEKIKLKIESRFAFVSLSYIDMIESTVHLMNSQKLSLQSNIRVSGFPCFSFYSNENVYEWFSLYLKEFNKKHKIKSVLREASL